MDKLQYALQQLEKAEQLKGTEMHKRRITICQEIESIFKIVEDWDNYLISVIMWGESLWRSAAYKACIKVSLKALELVEYQPNIKPIHIANISRTLSICYSIIGHYDKAINYAKVSVNNREDSNGSFYSDVSNDYSNLGIINKNKGDYAKAEEYYKKALKIRLVNNYKWGVANSYNNLCVLYLEKESFEKAIMYCKKAISIHQDLTDKETSLDVLNNYANLGRSYLGIGDMKNAIKTLRYCIAERAKLIGKNNLYDAIDYINLGLAHKNDTDRAVKYIEKAIFINKAFFGYQHPEIAFCNASLAAIYFDNAEFLKSIEYCKKAFQNLFFEKNIGFESKIYALPLLTNYSSSRDLLPVITYQGKAFYKLFIDQTHSSKDLLAAQHSYHLTTQLIDQMRQSYQAEGSKLILAQNAKAVYEEAIEVSLTLQKVAKEQPKAVGVAFAELQKTNPNHQLPLPQDAKKWAFNYSEKSKAVVLFGNLKDNQAKLTAGIPKDLLDKEYDLRVALNYLEKRLNNEKYKKEAEKDENKILEYESKIFEHKQAYEALIHQFETDYPDYYILKYQTEAVSIQAVQAALDTDTCLLEYFVGEKHLYVFAITPTEFEVHRAARYKDFEEDIKGFLESGIGTKGVDRIAQGEYAELGYLLFQFLVAPILKKMNLRPNTDLIIIPDGILAKLPFEALLTQEVKGCTTFANFPYLLMDYDISYHYSATLWHYQQQKAKQQKAVPKEWIDGFIGFAPVYNDKVKGAEIEGLDLEGFDEGDLVEETQAKRKELAAIGQGGLRSTVNGIDCVALPYSEKEVKDIQQAFLEKNKVAKSILHEAATTVCFKQEAQQYKYVLVSAHADFREKQPELTGIIFSPDTASKNDPVFYMSDAYNLQLKADLVVLSCCDSGIGEEAKGEGVIALNRGFLYAGAKNVVFTLFKIQDKAAYLLTKKLFEEILTGKPYKQALRLAKKHLIQKDEKPVNWAGYVLIGG